MKQEKLLTTKDYSFENATVVWAVISKENAIMQSNFCNKEEAEHFRDNAYCGYYKNCIVQLVKK